MIDSRGFLVVILLLKFDRCLHVGKIKQSFASADQICSEATFSYLQKARNIAKGYDRTCVIIILILAVVSSSTHERPCGLATTVH